MSLKREDGVRIYKRNKAKHYVPKQRRHRVPEMGKTPKVKQVQIYIYIYIYIGLGGRGERRSELSTTKQSQSRGCN